MNILITNFTKYKTFEIGEFIRKHALIGASALIKAEDLTEEIVSFVKKYSLNLIVELDGVEGGFYSIKEVLRRNPQFEELMNSIPRNKVEIARACGSQPDTLNLVGLALNWPRIKVWALRGHELSDSFYKEFELYRAFIQENQDLAPDINITFEAGLDKYFSIIDYGTLENLKIVGAKECLVTSK